MNSVMRISVRLDATTLTGTAAVVRHRGNVDDGVDFQTDGLEGANGAVATEAGTGNLDHNVLKTMGHGVTGGVLSDDLGGVGGGLTRTAEVALTSAGPSDDLALGIGDRDDRVVERREDVGDA